MNKRDKLAEKLYRENAGWKFNPYHPQRTPQLSDLWPCDQEKWKRIADIAIATKGPTHEV